MRLKKIIGLVLLITSSYTFAGDNVAREELNPPPPEGALLANQIPPITTIGKGSLSPLPNNTQSGQSAAPVPTTETPPSRIIMGQ